MGVMQDDAMILRLPYVTGVSVTPLATLTTDILMRYASVHLRWRNDMGLLVRLPC
jgi:hypothetical protein